MQSFIIEFAVRSDIGQRRRENEDSVYPSSVDSAKPAQQLFMVADGMGGLAGGRAASETAIAQISSYFEDHPKWDLPTRLQQGFNNANAQIYAFSASLGQQMGTTCTALAISGNQACLAHIGDSRLYRIRGGSIEQLSEDHSSVAEMVRRGLITKEEARQHPNRSLLTRALGIMPKIEIDIVDKIALQEQDRFLLCSDGLKKVTDKELQDIVLLKRPQEACDILVDLANERGGEDNITVAIIHLKPTAQQVAKKKSYKSMFLFICLTLCALLAIVAGWQYYPTIQSFLTTTIKKEDQPVVLPPSESNLSRLDSLLRSAQALLQMQAYEKAYAAYGKVFEISPMNLEAIEGVTEIFQFYMRKGDDFYSKRSYDEALMTYEKAAQIHPADSLLKVKIIMIKNLSKHAAGMDSVTGMLPKAKNSDAGDLSPANEQIMFDSKWIFSGKIKEDYTFNDPELIFCQTPLEKQALQLGNFSDFEMEVQAHKLQGDSQSRYGFILGLQQDSLSKIKEYYLYTIDDEVLKLEKIIGNQRATLFSKRHSAIGHNMVTIKARCIGQSMHLLYNGIVEYAMENENMISGQIGLYSSADLRVRFSNFKLVQLVPKR